MTDVEHGDMETEDEVFDRYQRGEITRGELQEALGLSDEELTNYLHVRESVQEQEDLGLGMGDSRE